MGLFNDFLTGIVEAAESAAKYNEELGALKREAKLAGAESDREIACYIKGKMSTEENPKFRIVVPAAPAKSETTAVSGSLEDRLMNASAHAYSIATASAMKYSNTSKVDSLMNDARRCSEKNDRIGLMQAIAQLEAFTC